MSTMSMWIFTKIIYIIVLIICTKSNQMHMLNDWNVLQHWVSCSNIFKSISQSGLAIHSGSKWLKPAENKFTQSDFTSFSKQVTAESHNFLFRSLHLLCIKNLSNWCIHRYDLSILRFFNLIFVAFFSIGPNYAVWVGQTTEMNTMHYASMTQLLSHTFAHLTGPSFRLKAKRLPNKKN